MQRKGSWNDVDGKSNSKANLSLGQAHRQCAGSNFGSALLLYHHLQILGVSPFLLYFIDFSLWIFNNVALLFDFSPGAILYSSINIRE